MSRLIREKFSPTRPLTTNCVLSLRAAGVSRSSRTRNGSTIAARYRSRFWSIQALWLLRPSSRKKRIVSFVKTALEAFISAVLILAAARAAAAPAARRAGFGRSRTACGLRPIPMRCEDRELDRALGARALRARDFGLAVHHDVLVVRTTLVANIFVDWHRSLR